MHYSSALISGCSCPLCPQSLCAFHKIPPHCVKIQTKKPHTDRVTLNSPQCQTSKLLHTGSTSSSSPREPWSVPHSPVTRTNHADFLGCCHLWVWPLELLPARRHSKAQGASIYTRHSRGSTHPPQLVGLLGRLSRACSLPFPVSPRTVHEQQGGCWFSKCSWQIFSNILNPYKTNEIVTWCLFCGKQRDMKVV